MTDTNEMYYWAVLDRNQEPVAVGSGPDIPNGSHEIDVETHAAHALRIQQHSQAAMGAATLKIAQDERAALLAELRAELAG